MGTRNRKVDAYIAKSADWSRPILSTLRDRMHETCPDVEEDIKWGRPSFMYHGKILAGMSAFKEHCALYYWNGGQIVTERAGETTGPTSQFGRLKTVKDIPAKKVIAGYTKKAMELIDAGVTPARAPAKKKPPVVPPDYFIAALKKNKKAHATFEAFPPSHRREYVDWITDAKGEDTRARRIAQAIEWLAEGKPRNWKYMR